MSSGGQSGSSSKVPPVRKETAPVEQIKDPAKARKAVARKTAHVPSPATASKKRRQKKSSTTSNLLNEEEAPEFPSDRLDSLVPPPSVEAALLDEQVLEMEEDEEEQKEEEDLAGTSSFPDDTHIPEEEQVVTEEVEDLAGPSSLPTLDNTQIPENAQVVAEEAEACAVEELSEEFASELPSLPDSRSTARDSTSRLEKGNSILADPSLVHRHTLARRDKQASVRCSIAIHSSSASAPAGTAATAAAAEAGTGSGATTSSPDVPISGAAAKLAAAAQVIAAAKHWKVAALKSQVSRSSLEMPMSTAAPFGKKRGALLKMPSLLGQKGSVKTGIRMSIAPQRANFVRANTVGQSKANKNIVYLSGKCASSASAAGDFEYRLAGKCWHDPKTTLAFNTNGSVVMGEGFNKDGALVISGIRSHSNRFHLVVTSQFGNLSVNLREEGLVFKGIAEYDESEDVTFETLTVEDYILAFNKFKAVFDMKEVWADVNGRRGAVIWDGRPEHQYVKVKWADDGTESEGLAADQVRFLEVGRPYTPCPSGCGYQVTWHLTHCCGRCSNMNGHGAKCDRVPCPVQGLEGRRPAVISGLDLLPYFEYDPAFLNFETIIQSEANAIQRPELARARVYYRRIVERYPTNYAALVNLACCHALLNCHVMALPLLRRATKVSPERVPAYVNQVLSHFQLRESSATYAAIERTFAAVDKSSELLKEQRSLLLRIKAALLFRSCQVDSLPLGGHSGSEAVSACCEAAAAAALEDPLEAPIEARLAVGGGPGTTPKFRHWEADSSADLLVLEELREGLVALKDPPVDSSQNFKPPWGRRYAYWEDKVDTAGQSHQHRWRPLRPDQVDELRAQLQNLPCGDPSQQRGRAAYEAAKSLIFMRRLEAYQAIGLLNSAELVELPIDEPVYREGEPADYMYIIVSGTVRSQSTIPMYGPHPVTLDTLYDGQSFGERLASTSNEVQLRRATVIAQEDVVLLRFHPMDYRRAIGADVQEQGSQEDQPGIKRALSTTILSGILIESRLRVLTHVPFFEQCSENHLILLAQNAHELDFRFGDAVVQVGEVPRGCFIISEGFCKLCMPTEGKNLKSLSLGQHTNNEENVRLQHAAEEQQHEPRGSAAVAVRCTNRYALRSHASPFRGTSIGSHRQSASGAIACSSGDGQRPAESGVVVVSTHYAPLRPASARRPVTPKAPNSPRKPGAPRPRNPWASSLRGGLLSFSTGCQASEEIDLGYLAPGESFGLGALYESKGECPYTAGVTVRVDSNNAKILVFTQRSLMYLPDSVGSTVIQKCRDAVDPAQSSEEAMQEERKQYDHWATLKQKLLQQEMTTVD